MPANKFYRKLPHDVPAWVEEGSPFFLTVCTEPRGKNQLATECAASKVLTSVKHYHHAQKWFVHICLLMPDHMHLVASFSRNAGMKQVMKAWKSYNHRFNHIEWQPDFFDHRLRTDGEFQEKMSYIRQNPVRANLVEQENEWPFVWDPIHGSPLLQTKP